MVLLFALRTQEQTGDALGYAYRAETGQTLLGGEKAWQLCHPHHLLFEPSIRAVWQGMCMVHASFDMILAGQLHNILWAASGILSAYFLVKQLFSKMSFAVLACLCFLSFRGFWELSTVTTVYVPTAASMMILSAILLCRENKVSGVFVLLMTVSLSLCILQHQFNVLFCAPIMFYLVLLNGRKGLATSIRIISLAGVLVLMCYILAFVYGTDNARSFGGFWDYCLRYALSAQRGWGTVGNFGLQGVEELLRSQTWSIIGWSSKMCFYFMVVAMGTVCVWNAVCVVKKSAYLHVRIFFLLWLCIYLLLFLWWLPLYAHLFVVTSFPIFVLFLLMLCDIGGMFKRREIFVIIALSGTCALLGCVNAQGAWRRHKYPSDAYVVASRLVEMSHADDVIMVNYHVQHHLLYYFGRRNVRSFDDILRSFYMPHWYPDREEVGGGSNIIMPVHYLSPDYTISVNLYNGRSYPSGWKQFISWLFDCQSDDDKGLISCRKYRMVVLGNDTPYVVIQRERMTIAHVGELLKGLGIEL